VKHPAIELKNLSTEENFAIAALYKQKECLTTWINYISIKNINLPEERETYKKRIAQINDAIKILEDELLPNNNQSSEKKLVTKISKAKTPIRKNTKNINSKSNNLNLNK